jgi:Na+-translocating ferredoxin:NAD+ oxidoreductase RnfE subunit
MTFWWHMFGIPLLAIACIYLGRASARTYARPVLTSEMIEEGNPIL